MWRRAGFIYSVVIWIVITIWLNVLFENQSFFTVGLVGSIQALRRVQIVVNVVWFLAWLGVLKFMARNDPELKREIMNVSIRIAILFAILVSFILGHVLSILIGIRHYTAMGIVLFYAITYCIVFVIGIGYVLVQTPKIGWKCTLRNGLIASFILGFIVVTILGIPISE